VSEPGLGGAVRAAAARLAEAGVASPESDAVALAAHALGCSVGDVRKAMVLGAPAPAAYEALVAERADRVPLQHLTGRAPFRHLELAVGPGVFVPRPETEVVAQAAVDEAAALVASGRRPVVVDLCTGSGAIALAVATEVPEAVVHAVELSPHAVAWAERNVAALAPGVELRTGDAADAFGDLDGEVDVVVSNPPYVPPGAVPVDPEVRDHDPEVALYGLGSDGLHVPRTVLSAAARLLRPGGLFVMEHADVQQDALLTMLTSSGLWQQAAGHPDLTGRPRYVVARRGQPGG
jgi:release factor glutamine methyltransferase